MIFVLAHAVRFVGGVGVLECSDHSSLSVWLCIGSASCRSGRKIWSDGRICYLLRRRRLLRLLLRRQLQLRVSSFAGRVIDSMLRELLYPMLRLRCEGSAFDSE